MPLIDVLIHFDKKTDETEKENIVEQLRAIEGVIAPRFNKDREHLLLVSYNPDAINALTLLNKVRDKGYQAQLIGI